MNIVVVSCVFPPEPIVSSQTSHQIVEALVKNGHHVKAIVPFPSRPAGKIYDGYTQKLFGSSCSLDGYDLVRCWSTVSSKSTIGSRFKENFSFGLSSAIVLLISPKPDAIYSNTWPIFATGLVALIAKLRDIPLVISVQDLYPESLVIQNRIQKDGWIAQILRLIDKLIAQSTTHVIVISEEFAKIYLKDRSVIPSKVSIIPNWLKAPSTNKTLEANYRSHYSIPNDDFVIVYGGNIGVAAGVETLVDSFTYLKHNSAASKLWLIVAGSGSNLANCQEIAQRIGSSQVIFHTPWEPKETTSILNTADVLILPTKGNQSMVSVPSKLISYMLSGKPILSMAVSKSELDDVMQKAQCGWVVEPDNSQLLADRLVEIMQMAKTVRMVRGESGKDFAVRNFVDTACVPPLIKIIEDACHRIDL